VPIITLQGMWSDVIFARGKTMVLGYSTVQFTEVKTQSNYSNSGSLSILLHLKALPLSGNSTSQRWPIMSLNNKVSWTLSPCLFRFASDRSNHNKKSSFHHHIYDKGHI
jgi:hypothetical protein